MKTLRTLARALRYILLADLSLSLFLISAALLPAQTNPTAQAAPPSHPQGFHGTVYVADFDLDAQAVSSEGVLGAPQSEERPHILRRRAQSDPAAKAHKLVDALATNLVADLSHAGVTAQRLPANVPVPVEGLVVRGIFTQVDEGNRIRRAVIGFGAGAAKMDLYVEVSDLAHPGEPLYSFAHQGSSGKMPGAVVTMNPVVAAAKFSLDQNSLGKALKHVSAQITAEIIKRIGAPASEPQK